MAANCRLTGCPGLAAHMGDQRFRLLRVHSVAGVSVEDQMCVGPALLQDNGVEVAMTKPAVHGKFNLAKTIATPGRLWVVDVEGLGVGPRAYDVAETLLVAAGHGHITESAAARRAGHNLAPRATDAIAADNALIRHWQQ